MPDAAQTSRQSDREDLAAFFLRLRSQETLPVKLLEVVESLPRRAFFPDIAGDLYANHALPLPCGETAAGASTILRTLAALKVQPDSRVLEVGTGSGYVTALLGRLCARVTSLERFRTLRDAAAERMKHFAIGNATLVLEDGREGYRDGGPYDRVIVHGAFEDLPRAFLDQMASPGILVCAIGPADSEQMLTRNHKAGSRFETETLFKLRTQPLKPGVALVL